MYGQPRDFGSTSSAPYYRKEKPGSRRCFNCGKSDHLIRDCTQLISARQVTNKILQKDQVYFQKILFELCSIAEMAINDTQNYNNSPQFNTNEHVSQFLGRSGVFAGMGL